MPVAAMIDFSMPETEPKYRISAPSAEASSINGSKGTTCPADPPPVNASLLPANVFPWSCVTIQLIRMSKREVRPNDVAPPSYRPPRINEHCQRPPCHRSERQINCLYPAIMPAMPSDPYQMLQLKGSTVETFDEGVWSRPNDRCRSARRRSDRDRPRATTVRSWPIDCAREPSGIRALHVAPATQCPSSIEPRSAWAGVASSGEAASEGSNLDSRFQACLWSLKRVVYRLVRAIRTRSRTRAVRLGPP